MKKYKLFTMFFVFMVVVVLFDTHATPKTNPHTNTVPHASTYTNSIGIEFVLIPSGLFMMGADLNFEDGQKHELPQHPVTISTPFYLSQYEVTQRQWVQVMGHNPSRFKDRARPVEMVSWEDVQRFIQKLNAVEGDSRYRLPTEAEWEYACRAGQIGTYSFGDDADQLGAYGWFERNADHKTHPIGQKKSNAWGLFDMHGNVWEWVQDLYKEAAYSSHAAKDPHYEGRGSDRVFRGGSWDDKGGRLRCADRVGFSSGNRSVNVGFRLLRMP